MPNRICIPSHPSHDITNARLIKEAKIQSLKIEDDQEETNSWWYSVIAVIAVLLVSVILLLLGKLHKKNILLEETRKVDVH